MTCPFCESDDVEMVAPWGGQIITSQMRCRACNTYFEAIRDEFDGAPDLSEAPSSWTTSSADDR
jgi:C4-type Zn-finger protein